MRDQRGRGKSPDEDLAAGLGWKQKGRFNLLGKRIVKEHKKGEGAIREQEEEAGVASASRVHRTKGPTRSIKARTYVRKGKDKKD